MPVNLALAFGLHIMFNLSSLSSKQRFSASIATFLISIASTIIPSACVWLFIIFSITSVVLSPVKQKAERTTLIAHNIIACAAFANLNLITTTTASDIQYDFPSCYNYIQYILENNFMFWHENPLLSRPSYSTYHPFLHFYLAAVVHRLAEFIGSPQPQEATQILFCAYMALYYVTAARILSYFNLKPAAYLSALAYVCFFPAYNAISGFFNNDCLLLLMQALLIDFSLRYYHHGGTKNLAFIWLAATLGALTKLSAVVILPFTAAALLSRLYNHWHQQGLDTQLKQEIIRLVIFGFLIIAGFSLWPLYQHFKLGLAFDFVPPQHHLSLSEYTLWQRLNPIKAIFYHEQYYHDFGINLWETMSKTALFGQWDFSFRAHRISEILTIQPLLYKSIIVTLWLGCIWLATCRHNRQQHTLILILFIAILSSMLAFSLKHPYMCSQDFRFAAIIVLPEAVLLGQLMSSVKCAEKILPTIIWSFALTSLIIWWTITLP